MESYVNPAPLAANANRAEAFDLSFKVFHELMARKINRILLVSSPYDAYIMEEEGRLAQRIIEEYRGLNLSRPPHLTWVSTAHEALTELERHPFDSRRHCYEVEIGYYQDEVITAKPLGFLVSNVTSSS